MFRNYLKIIFRGLSKNKIFTAINIAGLTVSLTSVMLIILFIRYELSYDSYLAGSGDVFRVYSENVQSSDGDKKLILPTGLGETLKKEFPEVADFIQLSKERKQLKAKGNVISINAIGSDNAFFRLFPFTFIAGNATNSLAQPDNIILSESTAKKLFNSEYPVGKTILGSDGESFIVTGVIKDIPANTHFQADAIFSLGQYQWSKRELNWRAYSGIYHYVLLAENVNPKKLIKKMGRIYAKYQFPKDTQISLQSISSIHLHSNFTDELEANSDVRYVYIFAFAAFLILLIASINYINLTTARSLFRARETGIRKVLGASRKNLVFQFLCETIFFFFLSTLGAAALTYLVYPLFATFLHLNPAILTLFDVKTCLLFLTAIILFGCIAGLYPSFYLSKQSPALIIKGIAPTGNLHTVLRKSLVVFQFSISIFFIVATITIFSQLRFIQYTKLGFDKEQLVVLPFHIYDKEFDAFRNELQKNKNVADVTISSWYPGLQYGGSSSWQENDTSKKMSISHVFCDFNFIQAMKVELLLGSTFPLQPPSDTGKGIQSLDEINKPVILNETAVKYLELKNPVGKKLNYGGLKGTVIGVVKDFNGLSLHHLVPPLVLEKMADSKAGYAFIRFSAGNVQGSLEYLQRQWKQFFPGTEFEFSFIDESLQKLYTSEKRLAGLFTTFSILGIGISCLGLLGLALFMAEQRAKEISIRKVLGASVRQIVNMLSTEFLKPIVIAAVLAFPLVWWAMNIWLENFAYRITMRWWFFGLAVFVTIGIAAITIGYQAIKAAVANPVKSLSTE
jgi:putative ABC transport system permease protein